jgi:hypothetical protein
MAANYEVLMLVINWNWNVCEDLQCLSSLHEYQITEVFRCKYQMPVDSVA